MGSARVGSESDKRRKKKRVRNRNICLPLQWPPLEATYRLVVAGSECLFVLSLFAPRRKHFCHQLLLHVLGFDMESSFVDCYLVYSMYAEGSCGSGVPFCDRYNTQLRIGLFVFLPLDFLA